MTSRCLLGLLLGSLFGSPVEARPDALRYLPSDTRVVVTVHPPSLDADGRQRGEALLRRLFTSQISPGLSKDEPLAIGDLNRVMIAFPYAGSLKGVFLLEGKIDAARFERQMTAAVKAGEATVEALGKPPVPVYKRVLDPDRLVELVPALARVPAPLRKLVAPQEIYLTLPESGILFGSMAGRTPLERALRARPATTRPRTTAELTTLLAKQEATDIAVVTVLDAALHPGLHLLAEEPTREAFEQFDHVVSRVRGGKEVSIAIRIQGKSAEAGAALEARSKQALTTLRDLFTRVIASEPHRRALVGAVQSFRTRRAGRALDLSGRLSLDDVRLLLTPPQKKDSAER